MSVCTLKRTSTCQISSYNFGFFNLPKNWYAAMTTTNMSVTMETHTNADEDSDAGPGVGYIVASGVLCTVLIVTIIIVLAYRYFHKRSGPLWITKFYHQDQYSTMKNDEVKEDQFILGFSNPIMEATDKTDGNVKPLAYRPLDADGQTDEKDQHMLQYKFLFPREKLTYGTELGSGWFGKVYKGDATRIVPGMRKTKVIIKKLCEDSTSEQRKRFLDEIAIYKSFDHKNVLEILGVSTEQQPYIVVFEYNPLGNLKEYLLSHRSNNALSTEMRLNPIKMSIDIGSGLEFLHSKSFYHSDLSTRNCIVNSDLSAVKIGDYGISRDLYKRDYYKDPKSSGESLPIRWLDPESVCIDKDSGISVKSLTAPENLWSFGVTLWEIIEYGRQPYEELTDEEVIQTVLIDRLYQLPEPKDTGILATQLYDMVKWCWTDSERRPSVEDMVFFLKGLSENMDDLLAESEEPETANTPSTSSEPHESNTQVVQQSTPKDDLKTVENISEKEDNIIEQSPISTAGSTSTSRDTSECNQIQRSEKENDVEVTAICDEHEDVPVTIIHSESTQENELRKTDTLDQELCNKWATPVTCIGGPSDGLTQYQQRLAQGTQEIIEPSCSRSEIVEVKYSGKDPSVVVESCPSGYVVLPGEKVRRKSSIRKAYTKAKGHTVHFPANILDLRVVHRFIPEPEEEEEYENTSHDDNNGESECSGIPPSSNFSFELESNEEHISLNTDCPPVEDENEIGSALILDRPTSPVEKRVRKATRRKPLSRNTDEWLFSLEQENS